jgi:hypothetical protein
MERMAVLTGYNGNKTAVGTAMERKFANTIARG